MNRLKINGPTTVGHQFGSVFDVRPMRHVGGNGHDCEHVKVVFVGGVSLELSQASAAELSRRLPESLAALPTVPDVSGHVWNGEEG